MTIDENRLKQIMKAEISDMISEDRLFITNLKLTEGLKVLSKLLTIVKLKLSMEIGNVS